MMTRKLAPLPMMLSGMLVSFVLLILAVHLASHTPWLGLELDYDEDLQLPVIETIHNPEFGNNLKEGDRLESIRSPDTDSAVSLYGFRLRVEPPSNPTFAEHNAQLAREDQVAAFLKQPTVIITTLD